MSALSSLDKVADILKTNKRRIIIEGHTDDTPISRHTFFLATGNLPEDVPQLWFVTL